MIKTIGDFNQPFFIGIAGTGMSALAQYLQGIGKKVSGSDRYFVPGTQNETKERLEAEGILCFLQNGNGITANTDLVVVSTAVEDTMEELQIAKQLNIPIIKRSELLALIAASKKTIAVGGTSGKSTTSAMLFDILEFAGMRPSIISGAGLMSIIKEGKVGNAKVGMGEWLVIEADESDGSIVQYHAEIGLLLNVDKDHKEMTELMDIFQIFKNNSKKFIINQSNSFAKQLSQNDQFDFSTDDNTTAKYQATDFSQKGFEIQFNVNNTSFTIHTIGKHNMENAMAAIAVANQIGVNLSTCAASLKNYEGIYRRHQVLGNCNGVWVVDDYAHNPAKCAASIEACREVAPKLIAWFQPHGYGPTRFLRNDFVLEISKVLRPDDEIWMSEIFYAGGTAIKDISANDLVNDIKRLNKKAFFVEDRANFLQNVKPHLTNNCIILLMGARDPSLEQFARDVFDQLKG